MQIGSNSKKTKRALIAITLVLMVAIILIVGYGYRGSGGGYRDAGPYDQEKACKKLCEGKGLDGRLVPVLTIRPANPYAYNGPWKCECE